MLILNRKLDEEIIINSEIVVKVLSISDGQIKIGISAPKEVEILRGELYEQVKENLKRASEESKINMSIPPKHKINIIRK